MKSFIFISVDHLRPENTHDIASQSEARKRKIRRVSVYYLLRLQSFAFGSVLIFFSLEFLLLENILDKTATLLSTSASSCRSYCNRIGNFLGRIIIQKKGCSSIFLLQRRTGNNKAKQLRQNDKAHFNDNFVQPERRSLSII